MLPDRVPRRAGSVVVVETFSFRFDGRFALMLRGIGITAETSRVTLTDDTFAAAFGRWGVETPIANLVRFEITRRYRWYRAIGVRGSLVDGGLTFGSNTNGGVCVCFHRPIDAIIPFFAPRHPGLTVTVADIDGLAAALRRYGVPG